MPGQKLKSLKTSCGVQSNPPPGWERIIQAGIFLIIFLFGLSSPCLANVVINEVYYDVAENKGSDNNNEWIELYNNGDQPVSLQNWTLTENGGVKTITQDVSIPAHGYALIANSGDTWTSYWNDNGALVINLGTSLGLNNTGDQLTLKDNNGTDVDFVAWKGGYNDSYLAWNLNAAKGESIARQTVGVDTNSAADWVENSDPSPGSSGISLPPPSPSPSPSPDPSPEPSPSPSPINSPTISPSRSPSPKISPKPSLKPTPSPKEEEKPLEDILNGQVFGESKTNEATESSKEEKKSFKFSFLALIISLVGLGFLAVASFPLIQPKISRLIKIIKRKKGSIS